MEPTDIPRRVTRACDYCRKKRLKCTGQRPCLNCQLYRATCTTSEPPNGAVAGRKRKRPPAGAEAGAEADPERSAPLNQHEENEDRPCPAPAATTGGEQPQPALAEQPWVPTSEPQIEIAPDFDQYARDLGLVLAPFWPPQSQLYPPLDELDATEEAVSGISYNHLPTPRLSEPFSLDLPPTTLGNLNPGPVGHPISPRSAHELFLKKGPLDSKFIGMGSVGSTIFECLRHSSSTQGNSMETTILNHLIRGIQHVDEMALSTPFHTPPLPEKDFAEEGVKTYYDFVHLLYPIMDDQFFQRWQHIYDDPSTLSPAAYSRFCLVVAIGNLASLRSDNATWEMAKLLQERTWSLMDHITANAFMESTQVLLLHTVFLLYSGKTGIAWTTCGMAIRTAQSLGLHQQTPSQLGLSAEHIKLRSRLWSVAYTLDAFLSLSEGRPPAATLPPNVGPSPSIYRGQSSPMAIDPPGLHVHDWDTGLATIANEVHLVLKDSDSAHSALSHIADIDSRLLAWKERIPMDFRPEQQILAEEPLYSILAILHLEYHNLMRSIHWISITLSSGMPPAKLSQMGARVRSSEAICLASARSVIDVLNSSTTEQKVARRQGGFVVPYCMAAISIFYRQIVKEPNRSGARSNLEHMRDGTLHIMNLYNGVRSRTHFQALFEEMLKVAEEEVKK